MRGGEGSGMRYVVILLSLFGQLLAM